MTVQVETPDPRGEAGGTRSETRDRLLEAARGCLLAEGFARLSTRRVAQAAGVPLSQIHYHFRGKHGLVLALLARENERLVERQRAMYGEDVALWKRYEQACDFLDQDLDSGYVRVLNEMIAFGWSDEAVAADVRSLLQEWLDVLTDVAAEAERRFGSLGPFSPSELGVLVGAAFLGAEAMILLGDPAWARAPRDALRRVGDAIRELEEGSGPERRPSDEASRPAPTPRGARSVIGGTMGT